MKTLSFERLECRLALDVSAEAIAQWAVGYGDVYDGAMFLALQLGADLDDALTNDLLAYRPQNDEFPRTVVWDHLEDSIETGPGIRPNFDEDDREDDLVEITINCATPGMRLEVESPLRIYYNRAGTELFDHVNKVFPVGSHTLWVEWYGPHDTAGLHLYDAEGMAYDSLMFHAFRSIVVVFGGHGEQPFDGVNDDQEGIFSTAQDLYGSGWDVLPLDEANISVNAPAGLSPTYRIIMDAYENGQIQYHHFVGYASGGGAASQLSEALWYWQLKPTGLCVFVDAIWQDSLAPVSEWPLYAMHLVNIYHSSNTAIDLEGGPIYDVPQGIIVEQVNADEVEGWQDQQLHDFMDDDPEIRDYIMSRFAQWER